MSEKDIYALLSELGVQSQQLLDGNEFFVSNVVDRVRKVASQYPHDQALLSMQKILEAKVVREGSLSLINQRKIQEIYDEVSALGDSTIFADELGDFLIRKKEAVHKGSTVLAGSDGKDDLLSSPLVNQAELAEYQSLFSDPNDNVKKESFVNAGCQSIEMELRSLGFASPTVVVAAKNKHFVVFAAEVSTANKRIPFMVPAEIQVDSVLLPSVFVSAGNFVNFTAEEIKAHGSLTNANSTPESILSTLTAAMEKVEFSKCASGDFGDESIVIDSPSLYGKINVSSSTQDPMLYIQEKMPDELAELSSEAVQETLLESGMKFGRDIVLLAKSTVSNELKAMDFNPGSIKVSSESSNEIVLTATISGKGGKKTIEVPVEIIGDSVLIPSVFASNSGVKPFSQKELRAFVNDEGQGSLDVALSNKYHMDFKSIYNSALKNAVIGNYAEVEECLAIIGEKYGPSYHKLAFQDLMGLAKAGFGKENDSPVNAIDQYIKEASSKIRDKEANIKMNNTLLMLYPKGE